MKRRRKPRVKVVRLKIVRDVQRTGGPPAATTFSRARYIKAVAVLPRRRRRRS